MDDTRKFVQERFERASLSGNNIDARWARVQFNLRAYAINVRARMLRSIGIDIGSLYLPVETSRLLVHAHGCLPTIDLPSGASDYLGWDAERIANTAILRKRNPGGKHEGRRIENAVFPPSLHALSPNTFPRVQDSLPDLFSLKFSSSK